MAEIDIKTINKKASENPSSFILEEERRYKDFTREVAARVAKNDKIFCGKNRETHI